MKIVTEDNSYILTGKCKTKFEKWFWGNVNYTPLKSANDGIWNIPKFLLYTHIVMFFDSEKEYLDTLNTYIASICLVNGKELGVYRDRQKAIEQGIIFLNDKINGK